MVLLDVQTAAVLLISFLVVIILCMVLKVTLNRSRRRDAHSERNHRERSRSKEKKKSSDRSRSKSRSRGEYLPVKTICHAFSVEPSFSCGQHFVDIELDISGGFSPYEVKWEDGTIGRHYPGAPYSQDLKVTVTDAAGCKTEKTIFTPTHSGAARCSP
jgi:hypothetical protein